MNKREERLLQEAYKEVRTKYLVSDFKSILRKLDYEIWSFVKVDLRPRDVEIQAVPVFQFEFNFSEAGTISRELLAVGAGNEHEVDDQYLNNLVEHMIGEYLPYGFDVSGAEYEIMDSDRGFIHSLISPAGDRLPAYDYDKQGIKEFTRDMEDIASINNNLTTEELLENMRDFDGSL